MLADARRRRTLSERSSTRFYSLTQQSAIDKLPTFWELSTQRHCASTSQRYLFYHAIELYLKAFLRAGNFPLDKVERFRHRFHRLRDTCTSLGLALDLHEREVLTLIGTDETYIRARYLRTESYSEVAVKDLSWAAASIAQKVGVQLRQRRIPLQRIEPSRFSRT
jgi:hypothetical protein